jgi:hypothetical protein
VVEGSEVIDRCQRICQRNSIARPSVDLARPHERYLLTSLALTTSTGLRVKRSPVQILLRHHEPF